MIKDTPLEEAEEFCFLCGSARVSKSSSRRPVDFFCVRYFYRCKECKGFTLWPKLEDWEIQSLYSSNYIGDVNPESSSKHDSNLTRFDSLIRFLPSVPNFRGKKFLDYGCGESAEVVLLAKNLGYVSFGVEVASDTRKHARQISDCEIYSPEELFSLHQKFDVAFLGDVLEHVCNPTTILSRIFERLNSGGSLVIQGPIEGAPTFANLLLTVKSRYLTRSPSTFPPYHVSLATQNSIVKMLESLNFNIVKIEISEPLWPAAKLGSKASFESFPKFLFSVAKFIDMAFHKFKKSHGTRFFLVATRP